MDPSGRPQPGALDASLSIIDLSGAPPAYARYDHASSSRTRDSLASISTKVHSKQIEYYYSNNKNNNASTSTAMGGRSPSKYMSSSLGDQRALGSSSAPEYLGREGEVLSEKHPHGQATQTHPSISHTSSHPSCGRTSATLRIPPHYPPTAARDETTSSCACFHSLPPKVKLWLSFGAWIATSAGFLLAVAFWKTEVFTALDNLSGWLVEEGDTGYAYMFALIVLTTIPPFPLYSTLMMLAGYTWGTWTGFVLSYTSSLFGAIVVYFISRYFFGTSLISLLRHMPSFARTVRAVSRNPKLLFLVRLAPYPYNVMNVLLAACPSLRWRTYIGCTAFSLLKVVIHTSIGSGIRSFKSYHGVGEGDGIDDEKTASEQRSSDLAKWSTVIGVILCVLLFLYLGHIARKAVDVELEDEDMYECPNSSLLPVHRLREDMPRSPNSAYRHQREPSTAEERMAFLSPVGNDSDEEDGIDMTESRLGGSMALVGSRQNVRR